MIKYLGGEAKKLDIICPGRQIKISVYDPKPPIYIFKGTQKEAGASLYALPLPHILFKELELDDYLE